MIEEEILNEIIEQSSKDTTAKRKAERRKRQREKRKLEKQCNVTSDGLNPLTAELTKPKKVLTYEDLDPDQKKVYHGIAEWWENQQRVGGVAEPLVVAGFSGSGKTTTLSVSLPALENPDGSKPKIAYAAYTGKAADVMRTKGMDASTIHYLIYNWFQTPQGLISQLKDRDELDADIIVIDEASMVGTDLREELESIGIPVIYTGDHGQLSPVSDNPNSADENVMMNPHFKLEKVHRQALESGIISVGVDVRMEKRVPKGVYGINKDMIKVGSDAINDLELLNSADIFICYTNRIRNKYNTILRDLRGFEGTYPQVGEKLICTRNNREDRMFNGLIVTVESVKYEFSFLWMDLKDESGNMYYKVKVHPDYFEDGTHPKTFGKMVANYFEFGYCISGHRSQGSEWPSVVFVEEKMSMSTREEKRRWIYTVMTRAREKCVWISKFK